MSAPLPHEVLPPCIRAEPVVRIGIVIARDRKSSIELETPEDGYSFAELNGEARSVPAGRAGIEVCGDRLLVDTTAPSRMNYRVLLHPMAHRQVEASWFEMLLRAGDFIGAK